VRLADVIGRRRIEPVVLQYYRRHSNNESGAICNQLIPLTRWHLICERLRGDLAYLGARVRGSSGGQPASEGFDSTAMEWLERVLPHAPPSCAQELHAFATRLRARQSMQLWRAGLAGIPIHRRLPKVWQNWRSGGYAQFRGWISMARDVLR
jgi:hypothetical protein